MTRASHFFLPVFAVALCLAAAPASAQFNAFKAAVAGNASGATSGPDLQAAVEKVDGGKITIGANNSIVTTFKLDERLQVMVPAEMRTKNPSGVAVYSNFRRFAVSTTQQ